VATDWFTARTYRWQDWELSELLAAKEHSGISVSLVVPARNEAATVGAVVSRVRSALVETVSLLDEIVVIDSDSDDSTFAVAQDAGAAVFRARDIRPDLGTTPGKGEAMWKSLFVTSGDLLVFMDADLLDWDTHFVPGLLGPLLNSPDVALVKGFYERPFGPTDTVHPYEGGRVTELVARPLIALHFPELAGLLQPLAGEWAIRRSLFESLQVPTGYAVELAALVDTARSLGARAIAQVDLGRRAHRHQSLRDLGAMATQVMAAAEARLRPHEGRGREVALRQYCPEGGAIDRLVAVDERPPARTVA
jgi:glucosyl-3-phosphoglycerate synthase